MCFFSTLILLVGSSDLYLSVCTVCLSVYLSIYRENRNYSTASQNTPRLILNNSLPD